MSYAIRQMSLRSFIDYFLENVIIYPEDRDYYDRGFKYLKDFATSLLLGIPVSGIYLSPIDSIDKKFVVIGGHGILNSIISLCVDNVYSLDINKKCLTLREPIDTSYQISFYDILDRGVVFRNLLARLNDDDDGDIIKEIDLRRLQEKLCSVKVVFFEGSEESKQDISIFRKL